MVNQYVNMNLSTNQQDLLVNEQTLTLNSTTRPWRKV